MPGTHILSPLYLPYFVERRLAILKQAPKQAGVAPSQKTKMANDVISELNKKILYRARNLARAETSDDCHYQFSKNIGQEHELKGFLRAKGYKFFTNCTA